MVMDKISAYIDGEASPAESREVMSRLKRDDACCQTWQRFHLIGDVMRGDTPLREDFLARFHARMEREPLLLTPRVVWRKTINYTLSAAASVAAVAIVLTLVLTDNPLKPQVQVAVVSKPQPQLQTAAAPQPLPAAQQRRVSEYLMAHQEFSPSTALQGVAPYVRTVAATNDSDER